MFFLVLVYVFNCDLFELISAAILEKGLLSEGEKKNGLPALLSLSSFLFCWDTTKALDLSRLISGPDRYVYGFGFSKFYERPAIVPTKTMDCIDQSQSTTET